MKHTLTIAISKDFHAALDFSDRAYELFHDSIESVQTGLIGDEFGSYFQFTDVRCVPALFDFAKMFTEQRKTHKQKPNDKEVIHN